MPRCLGSNKHHHTAASAQGCRKSATDAFDALSTLSRRVGDVRALLAEEDVTGAPALGRLSGRAAEGLAVAPRPPGWEFGAASAVGAVVEVEERRGRQLGRGGYRGAFPGVAVRAQALSAAFAVREETRDDEDGVHVAFGDDGSSTVGGHLSDDDDDSSSTIRGRLAFCPTPTSDHSTNRSLRSWLSGLYAPSGASHRISAAGRRLDTPPPLRTTRDAERWWYEDPLIRWSIVVMVLVTLWFVWRYGVNWEEYEYIEGRRKGFYGLK